MAEGKTLGHCSSTCPQADFCSVHTRPHSPTCLKPPSHRVSSAFSGKLPPASSQLESKLWKNSPLWACHMPLSPQCSRGLAGFLQYQMSLLCNTNLWAIPFNYKLQRSGTTASDTLHGIWAQEPSGRQASSSSKMLQHKIIHLNQNIYYIQHFSQPY